MRSKTLWVCLACVLLWVLPHMIQAQKREHSLRLGLTIGPEFSSRAKPAEFTSISFTPRFGYEINLGLIAPIGLHFGVQATVGTSMLRYQWKEIDFTDSDNMDPRTMHAVRMEQAYRIGIGCRYAFKGQDDGFFLTLGPEVTRLHQSATLYTIYDQGTPITTGRYLPSWSRVMVAAQFSAGYLWNFRSHIRLSIEPYARYYRFDGFKDIWTPSHRVSVGLRLGCWF